MAPDTDPYRTLGLSRDATLEEVRRAYRRLAKANHPDAAGEAALPRFLAIQAAYDRIAGPDGRTRRSGTTTGPTAPRRAWDAERDRTDATYRAYGGRSRRARPTGKPGPGSGQGRGAAGERSSSGPSSERPPGTGRPPRPERPPNKATLGSTSYDGAEDQPFEPDWGGASWYGTTSGTYWTLNPKEYADPRKHGPEYQARARRELEDRAASDGQAAAPRPPRSDDAPGSDASSPEASSGPAAAGQATAGRATAGPATAGPAAAGQTAGGPAATGPATAASDDPGRPAEPAARRPPPATHTTASWWEATAGSPPRPEAATPGSARPGERRPRPGPPAGTTAGPTVTAPGLSADTLLEALRTWLDDAHPGTVGRIARALVGWAPLALGIGWAGGEISGCGRFAAGCDDTVASSAWIVQIATLLILIAVGRLARITSVATLATLAAAIPAALLLSATGGPDDTATGRLALSGLLVIAWAVGLVFGVVREARGTARGPTPGPTGATAAGNATGAETEPPGGSDPARPVS